MGLNEAAGYVAASAAALASGYLATTYSLRPAPFVLGFAFALAGLLVSLLFVRESQDHVRHEVALAVPPGVVPPEHEPRPSFGAVFRTTSWSDRALFAVSQAGMVNNLNDGLAWGLFPLFFAAGGAGLDEIGWLAAIYLGVWGLSQMATGLLSDRVGRKPLIAIGMWVQALAISLIVLTDAFWLWVVGMVLLGLGTALVYPTLLAAIGDVAHPAWRASSVGIYRLWRDSGYAVGALLAGVLADRLGLRPAIGAVAVLTFVSGVVVATRMYETMGAERIELPRRELDHPPVTSDTLVTEV
jgi:predicted MFS family arabinose efflux permease